MTTSAQEYVKTIKLKFAADTKSLNYVREQISRSEKDIKTYEDAMDVIGKMKFGGKNDKETLENIKTYKELQKKLKELKGQKNLADVLEKSDDMKKKIKDNITSTFSDAFKKVAQTIGQFFQKELEDAIENLKSIASYNLSTSSTYSSDAWNMLKEYGVTGSDAYALKQAMSDIGVNSQDELMEALMQPATLSRFTERLAYWQDNYSDAQETGKAINDFILEWQDFKDELMMDFVDWFAENKDSVKTTLKFAITVLEGLAKVIGGIVEFFGGSDTSYVSTASDIVQNYSTVTKQETNNNVGITVNGTNATSIGQNVYSYLQTKLGIK